MIPTVRTLGGHRRVPLAGFLKFLEETNREVVSQIPGVPQIPAVKVPLEATTLAEQRLRFKESLVTGDEDGCRKVLTDWFAHHESFALVADEFIAATMTEIGDAWDCGKLEVYQERRACEICARLLHEFRRLIPSAPENAPLALGGTPAGDHYTLATQVVETVLRESHWRSVNLGSNLPLETFVAAVREQKPRMLWLSISHYDDEARFIADYENMRKQLPDDLIIVLGGRALNDRLRPKLKFTGHCDSMQHLAEFAQALHGRRFPIDTSEN